MLTQRVTINGVELPMREIRTSHDVDTPIGTGTLVMSSAYRQQVELGAPVKVQIGRDGDVGTVFNGKIANDATAFSEQGGTLRVSIEGHGKLLWYADPAVNTINGPVRLDVIFRAFCTARGLTMHQADIATGPNGNEIALGGNTRVDDGKIKVEASQSPGAVIDRLARLFGYRTFDTPLGIHRFQKISGLPVGPGVRTFVEGQHLHRVQRTRTLAGMVNYWEVLGAAYTTAAGAEVAIRSIPSSVTPDPRLGPSGINHKELRDEALVTQALADMCRNVQEIDSSTPQYRWTWTVRGDADLQPGQVVVLHSPSVSGAVYLWLMGVSHTFTQQGWTTDLEGWAGNGVPLPAGNDCVTTFLLGPQGFHLGTEYLSHYRRPNPDGLERSIPFTLADGYTNATITGQAHGTNSFVGNTQSTASRFEIWQGGEEVASGELPRQNENLEQHYPYAFDQYWSQITVPLSGSLDAGSAVLKIISGYDSSVGDYDDFEVKNLQLRTCGVGSPVVVEPGG